jgi:REP element-mobilizing transposase RayT
MKRARQLELKFHMWGGKRRGSGRKRTARGPVPHRARPTHQQAHPVHVTLRASRRLPSLRKQALFLALRRALGATARSWFRVVHFSVQADHVHLLVEADDATSLSRGVRGVTIRLARAFNRAAGRCGKVWGDRYHARALRTPREVRNGIVYVLMNWKKHVASAAGFDPCSSARSFEGWKAGSAPWPRSRAPDVPPLEAPQTWLVRLGWKRRGLIDATERPAASL